jgi:hypothetical protein
MNLLESSVFDPGLSIKIIVHGYGGHFRSPYIIAAKNAILQAVRVFNAHNTKLNPLKGKCRLL